jgi:DNA-damage-inducible protein D
MDGSLIRRYNSIPLGGLPWGREMASQNVFHFDNSLPSFEDLGVKNGATHWSEELVRESLGYQTDGAFKNLVNRAMQACLTLGIPLEENFTKQPDGSYVFTRFACYLLAMNGDNKKPEVAAAQVWFAQVAATFQTAIEHVDGIDRIFIRDKVSTGEKSLASTACQHGIQNYAYFQNAGYRGMYNMNLSQIVAKKGIGKDKLIDRMGTTELAAHLFRITQTDERIKKAGVKGQRPLETIAHQVGQSVRKIMTSPPETLPPAEHVKGVKKKLQSTSTALKKIDGKGKSA